MIKAVIIDDEEDARFLLKEQLKRNFSKLINIEAEADSIEDGVKIIKNHKPDVVFLDIKMPTGTGFDVLSQIKDVDFEVVFITAHDDYAVKAFQFSAFGYLLKPIRSSELKVVVDKLEHHLNLIKTGNDQRLKVLIENYGDDKIKKLVISNMQGFQVLNIEDIIRLEGDRNYTRFISTGNKKQTTSKTLGEYEHLLTDYGFFRAHQSTIINLRHVKGFKKEGGGEIEMSDGAFVKLSRYRKIDFMKRFI
jgi:two-component system LytT family response regulator